MILVIIMEMPIGNMVILMTTIITEDTIVMIPITMVMTCSMDTIHTHLMVLMKRTCLIIPNTNGLILDITVTMTTMVPLIMIIQDT